MTIFNHFYFLTVNNNKRYPQDYVKKKLKLLIDRYKLKIFGFIAKPPRHDNHFLLISPKLIDYSYIHKLFGNGFQVYIKPLFSYKDADNVVEYIINQIDDDVQLINNIFGSSGSGIAFIPAPCDHEIPEYLKPKVFKPIDDSNSNSGYCVDFIDVKDKLNSCLRGLQRLFEAINRACEGLDLDFWETIKPYWYRYKRIIKAVKSKPIQAYDYINQLNELKADLWNLLDEIYYFDRKLDKAIEPKDEASEFPFPYIEIDMSQYYDDEVTDSVSETEQNNEPKLCTFCGMPLDGDIAEYDGELCHAKCLDELKQFGMLPKRSVASKDQKQPLSLLSFP